MKTKLAPRHIVPVVCYALQFVCFVLAAVAGFAITFTSSESLEGAGVVGLLVVGLAFAAKFVLILIGIGGSVSTLFPLVFSSINVAKRERKLAIACLVFDVLWCQAFLGASLATLIDFESIAPVIVSLLALGLNATALVMNVLNIKHNAPPAEAKIMPLLFRQRIMKEKIILCVATDLILLTLLGVVLLIGFMQGETDITAAVLAVALLFIPISLALLLSLNELEWYDVYEDRIEVKCIFGRKNVVYYREVQFVELVMIGVARGIQKPFYIFNDGRKNNSSILDINSPGNKKKFNLRIHYSPEMENHILNTLGMPIASK